MKAPLTRRARYFRTVVALAIMSGWACAILSAVFGGSQTYKVCPQGLIGWANHGTYICFTSTQHIILICLLALSFGLVVTHVIFLAVRGDIWREVFPEQFAPREPEMLKHFLFGKDKKE